jgi:hypothetical protein
MPDLPSTHSENYGQTALGCADMPPVKLRYAIGGIAAAALLALPAGVAASQGGQVNGLAAQQCSQEKTELGKKAFRKRYGAKHTMRACAKRTRPEVMAALTTASAACQNELAENGDAEFVEDYGEDATDTLDNAMEECIAEGVDEILNPEDYVDVDEDESD